MLIKNKSAQPRFTLASLGGAITALVFAAPAFGDHHRPAAPAAPERPPMAAPAEQADAADVLARSQAALQEVEARLGAAQEKAMESERVVRRQEALQDLLNATIVKNDTDLEPVLERSRELYNELVNHPEIRQPTGAPSDEVREKIEEYQSLEAQLAGPRQEVLQSPEFIEEQEALREVLISEMETVEPETRQLLVQRDAIIQRMQAHSPNMPGAPN
ncbi:MAG: hypothetical protein JJT96_06375 [Opitutales bacterium]|nr:hypothetical protein [Opitutales bacterium]